jgi:photosystem II stability/assembly factor-like uncharacterized protein
MVDTRNGWAVHDSGDGSAHVMKTEDGGLTWSDVSPPQPVYVEDLEAGPYAFSVATSFLDADHAWVSLDFILRQGIHTVWRTVDGGRHWEESLLGRRTYGIDWITFDFIDPLQGWAVMDVFLGAGSHTGEIFRTEDGGSTWETLLDNFGHANGIEFLNRRVGWISTDIPLGYYPTWGLAITQDGGLTWQRTTSADVSNTDDPTREHMECGFRVLRVSSALSGVIDRALCATRDKQGDLIPGSWLDFTSDGGRTWRTSRKPIGPPDFLSPSVGWAIGPIEVDLGTPPAVHPLYMTTDGGRTWSEVSLLEWEGDLDFVDENNGWSIDADGGLHRTADGGLTWEDLAPSSTSDAAPLDTTVWLDLPSDLSPITSANAPNIQLLATLDTNDPTSVLIFRNTLYVGNAHGQVLRWHLDTAVHAQPEVWRVQSDWVYDMAAPDDGGDLLIASRDGSLRLWELFASDGFWMEFPFRAGEALSAAIAPDLSVFASGWEDGTIKIGELSDLSAAEPRLSLQAHDGWVWDVAFSNDSERIASASADGTLKIWSVESGDLLGTLTGHTSTVSQVAFAPDGSTLASASWDGTLRIWDVTTFATLNTLHGHDDWVLGLAYSPSGELLASSGADGKVLLWDASSGELISQLVDLDAPVRDVAFDQNGRYLVAVADDDRVLVWGVAAP